MSPLPVLLIVLLGQEPAAPSATISYANQVAEILEAKCLGCHSAAASKGRLSLETVPGMLKGGKRGSALVPGRPDESRLFLAAARRAEPFMPPPDEPEHPPLTDDEIRLLERWIRQGASDDSSSAASAADVALGTVPAGFAPVTAVDLTSDGRSLAAGRGAEVLMFDVETGAEQVRLAGHADLIQSVRFSPDGRFLAAGSYRLVTIWVRAGETEWRPWLTLTGPSDRVLALDFHPDGTLLAAGSGEPSRSGEVWVWETGRGNLVRHDTTAHSDGVYGVRFSPDGAKLASASADRFVKVFDVATGRTLQSLEGHTNAVLDVDWSADGRLLVSGGADAVLKLWDVTAGEAVRTSQPIGKQITAVRWPRGAGNPVVATASGDNDVRLWNTNALRPTRTLKGPTAYVNAVAISSDRQRVAGGGGDGAIHIWDGTNGRPLRKIEPGP